MRAVFLSRTEDTEDTESYWAIAPERNRPSVLTSDVTSYFRLHASYFVYIAQRSQRTQSRYLVMVDEYLSPGHAHWRTRRYGDAETGYVRCSRACLELAIVGGTTYFLLHGRLRRRPRLYMSLQSANVRRNVIALTY